MNNFASILGSYSFLLILLALAGLSGVILLTNKPKWNDYLAFAVIASALMISFIVLHPRQTFLMDDARMVQEMIGKGKPVLLEFQSPYCIGCTTVKPVVDELEEELGNRILIIRLNIQEQVGRELAPVYGFQFTPTFIYFDGDGNELWRTIGEFDPQKVRDSLANE